MSPPLAVALAGQCLIERPLPKDDGLAEVACLLGSADVALTNLEVAITGRHGGTPRRTETIHVASPEVLDTLEALNVSLLALASNHAFDLGPEGIASALEETAARGFRTAGAGLDAMSARRPAVLTRRSRAVGMLAWNASPNPPGAAALDAGGGSAARAGTSSLVVEVDGTTARVAPALAEAALADVAVLAAKPGLATICYVHQHYWLPDVRTTPEWLVDFAHRLVDAGADLVVCHGPPVLHGVEVHRGRLIFYGLASLVFHTRRPERYPGAEAWESIIALVDLGEDGAAEALRLHPVVHGRHPAFGERGSPGGAPRLARGELAEEVLGRFAERSRERLGTVLPFLGRPADLP